MDRGVVHGFMSMGRFVQTDLASSPPGLVLVEVRPDDIGGKKACKMAQAIAELMNQNIKQVMQKLNEA